MQRGYTTGQQHQAMQQFWRVHCFKAYGGEDWLKILIALGHCRGEVTSIANEVLAVRIQEKANRLAATQTQSGPILSKRTHAAMSGDQLPEVQAPGTSLGSEAKVLRDKAKRIAHTLRPVL